MSLKNSEEELAAAEEARWELPAGVRLEAGPATLR